jgi:hypothetical protein
MAFLSPHRIFTLSDISRINAVIADFAPYHSKNSILFWINIFFDSGGYLRLNVTQCRSHWLIGHLSFSWIVKFMHFRHNHMQEVKLHHTF